MSLEQPSVLEKQEKPKEELVLNLETLVERISRYEKLKEVTEKKEEIEIWEEWEEKDLNLTEILKQRQGPLIEIGGPTNADYNLIDAEILNELNKKFFISNITPGIPVMDDEGNFLYYSGGIDFKADARQLPFRNNSLGGIFASCLPFDVRELAIKEAGRVIEENGLFIFKGGFENDIRNIEAAGFKIIKSNKLFINGELILIDTIFKKISK